MNKKVCFLSLLFALLLSFVSIANAGGQVFAFEDAEYSVLIGKTIKPKTVAQGIEGKLSYVWSSSDESIATVKKGVVKGISGGSVTLTCTGTAKDGAIYEALCTIHVDIPIQSIKAEQKSVEVALAPLGTSMFYKPGSQTEEHPYMYKPIITITPSDASNQTLKWSSANPSIASVAEDGTIFGESSGTTTITGKATDGSEKSVKIKVKVPSCYVTDDDITITEPEGMKIGYIRGSASGFNSYNISTKGKVVTFETLDDADGMDWIQIIPIKAGEGSLSFLRNGKTMRTIKIKVEHSAVYDDVSHPAEKVSTLVASPDSSIGTKTQVKCEVIKIEPQESLGYRGGLVYGMLTENSERYYVVFEYDRATLLEIGETYTIFGEVSKFVEYVTETGLVYNTPYFVGGHIN